MTDPATASRLHRRCSALMEARGDIDGAVRHAVAAHDFERSADLVLVHAVDLVLTGQVDQLGRWIELLGDHAVDRSPAAAIATAWYGLATGDAPLVRRAAAAAVSADRRRTPRRRFAERDRRPDDDPGDGRTGRRSRRDSGHQLRARRRRRRVELVVVDGHPRSRDRPLDARPGRPRSRSPRIEPRLGSATRRPSRPARLAHLALLDLRDGDLTNAEREADRSMAIAARHRPRRRHARRCRRSPSPRSPSHELAGPPTPSAPPTSPRR